ncbi:hypothetical protein ACFQHO_49220 [Actinomadura yumaensis]|uniref:hypothetical protein n=1 Tax=Actinomadura yumaensis TaxID=111807 RepID=UPI00361F5D8C
MSTAPGVTADAAGLLADYRPGSSFFFSSPERTVLAQGTWADVPPPRTPRGRSPAAPPPRWTRRPGPATTTR